MGNIRKIDSEKLTMLGRGDRVHRAPQPGQRVLSAANACGGDVCAGDVLLCAESEDEGDAVKIAMRHCSEQFADRHSPNKADIKLCQRGHRRLIG